MLDLLAVTDRADLGEVPLEYEVSVVPGGGITAGGKPPKQLLEPVRFV